MARRPFDQHHGPVALRGAESGSDRITLDRRLITVEQRSQLVRVRQKHRNRVATVTWRLQRLEQRDIECECGGGGEQALREQLTCLAWPNAGACNDGIDIRSLLGNALDGGWRKAAILI